MRTGPSTERWLLSYADFITLLLAVFATLYAGSTIDANKMASTAQGLQRAFAARSPQGPRLPGQGAGVLPAGRGIVGEGEADARDAILRELGDDLLAGRLELSEDARGLVLSIPEASAFPIASADLSPGAQRALLRLASVLVPLPNAVRVEGHTDDVPIHTPRFTSNWELSTARAIRVVQLLVEEGHMAPGRLSAAGYAEFHPRVANESADTRAQNRRVDVVILRAAVRAAEEPPGREPRR